MYDLSQTEILIRLLIAVVIGAIIGTERESNQQSAGLRTNIVVCVAACILTIIQLEASYQVIRMVLENPDLKSVISTDITRITAQIVSGIGFLGAGAILITKSDTVLGLTTAATIWCVAGLGIAVGMGYYFLAGMGCLIVLMVLYVLKKVVRTREVFRLDIKLRDRDAIHLLHQWLRDKRMKTTDQDFMMERTAEGLIYQMSYSIAVQRRTIDYNALIDELLELSDSIIEISFRD